MFVKPKRKNKSLNETKNIPKNFGKAIITFIYKNKKEFMMKLEIPEAEFDHMVLLIKHKKKTINTISELRELWSDFPYAKEIRKLSNLFLRKHGVKHIFNSRISCFPTHIKYRNRLIEALKNP